MDYNFGLQDNEGMKMDGRYPKKNKGARPSKGESREKTPLHDKKVPLFQKHGGRVIIFDNLVSRPARRTAGRHSTPPQTRRASPGPIDNPPEN